MLLSDRTKVVRAVLGFLAFCALIGFVMGLRSALPRNTEDTEPQGPPAEATSNVVVEASPAQETPAPAANEPAANEPTDNADAEQAAEEKAATKAEQTKPVAPAPAAAPAEEAPSNDTIGQVLNQQQQQNTAAPPPNLY